MAEDIDRLSKFIWVVGGTVFAQMCFLIVRSLMLHGKNMEIIY